MPRPRALLFDFNGVIADDEELHFVAAARVLAGRGVMLAREDYYQRYLGLPDRDLMPAAWRDATGALLSAEDGALLVQGKSEVYLELLDRECRLCPGAAELIAAMHPLVPLAICSGALGPEIRAVLGRHGLERFFSAVVSAEDVAAGKPAPDVFLLGCRRLRECGAAPDLVPQCCLVIEDSPNGVRAALAAGMTCLAVTTTRPGSALAEAHCVVDSLSGVTFELLRSLLSL